MNILYLVHQFYPRHDTGTEKVTLFAAKTAQTNGHNVLVVTYSFDELKSFDSHLGDIFFKYYEYEGLRIIGYRHKEHPQNINSGLKQLEQNHFVDSIFQSFGPHVIHGMHLMRTGAFIIRAIEHGIPYVLTLTDFWLLCHSAQMLRPDKSMCPGAEEGKNCKIYCPGQNYFEYSVRHIEANHILFNAKSVIVASDFLLRMFQNNFTYKFKYKFIPFGLDYANLVTNGKIYGKTADKNKIIFFFGGSLVYHKGVHVLIEAFKRVIGKETELHLYGYGVDDKKLKEMAREDERIHFMGRFNKESFSEIVQTIDVGIVPSVWYENNPLILQELIMANIPLIVSDIGSLPEMVENEVTGFTFEVGNVGALTQKMQRIADKPEILNDFKVKMRNSFIMSLEQMGNCYLDEYSKAITGRNRG